MSVNVTDALLRSALQLPQRPYGDTYIYDGNPDGSNSYFDLSRREVVSILVCSGTSSGQPFVFRNGTDFQLNAGSIDWTIPGGKKPDYGTAFTIDYTYSRLGSSAASTSMFNANIWATTDLGSSFPYGSKFANGLAANDVALAVQLCAAAREACEIMVSSEIDLADKYRRGSLQYDDTKKTDDWTAAAKMWESRYKRALILARGPVRKFAVSSRNSDVMVFPVGDFVPDVVRSIIYGDSDYGGII